MNRIMRKLLRKCGLYDIAIDCKYRLMNTEGKYVKFYSQFVNKGNMCFDIGANVGRRTAVFLRLGASVVVVEPHPHCIGLLKRKYGKNSNVILVGKAVGDKEGQAEMMLCDAHSLSSLSTAWIESVKASGRYANGEWDRTVKVPVVTLDNLISKYGTPAFLKIDVEGYERQVLTGLSRPIKYICFEFTSEFIDSAVACINRLLEFGPAQFNYCIEQNQLSMALSEWVNFDRMCEILASFSGKKIVGDIYYKFGT